MIHRRDTNTDMVTATLDNLLTVAEVADELGLTQHRVREFIRDSRISAVRRGKFYLVLRNSLEEFQKLERHTGRPPSSEKN